jgi:hypothetical protein
VRVAATAAALAAAALAGPAAAATAIAAHGSNRCPGWRTANGERAVTGVRQRQERERLCRHRTARQRQRRDGAVRVGSHGQCRQRWHCR